MASTPTIGSLIASIAEYRDRDITHPELGSANDFREAQALKKSLADYLFGLLHDLNAVSELADATLVIHLCDRINREGRFLGEIEREIDRIATEDLHTEQFPNEREKEIQKFREHVHTIKVDLFPFDGMVRALKVQRALDESNLEDKQRELRESLAMVQESLGEARKVLAATKKEVMERAVGAAGSAFRSLSQSHSRQEIIWLIVSIVAAAVTAWSVHIALQEAPISDVPHVVFLIFRRLLLISVPLLFLKVALVKYNLERNLHIVYANRDATLTQYAAFEAAIGDDLPAKNQFRLEIAKYIFSDPVTGYVCSDAAPSINISPAVSLLEKVMPGGK